MNTLELVEKIEGKIHDLQELVADLKARATGDLTKGQEAARLFKIFVAGWERVYRSKYAQPVPAGIGMIKRLIGVLEPVEIEKRMGRYLLSDDPYWRQMRHPVGVFVSQINRLAPQASEAPDDGTLFGDDAEIFDCQHSPRCGSDAIHTRKAQADRRKAR